MIWFALDHFLGRDPTGPFALGADFGGTLEFETFLADGNAIAACGRGGFNQIKELLLRIDDDGAGLVTGEGNVLRQILRIE